MTLEDIEGIFNKAAFDGECQFGGLDHRAGIRAVVEALRDEFWMQYGLRAGFDEILDSDGVDKAASNVPFEEIEAEFTPAQRARIDAFYSELRAVQMSLEELRKVRFGAFASTKGRFFCPSCGKPIKFKEGSE
jgi:hypothetical protein